MPLDVSYPASLMESVLTDAEPVAVVTSPDLADNIEGSFYIIRILYLFKNLSVLHNSHVQNTVEQLSFKLVFRQKVSYIL